jgi:3-(3-hydroxy-phenyl)propionate hydroxylase
VNGLTQDDVDVFRPAMHVFEGKLAKNWRAGRIFIGGDAAHAMTPFMGQGGCSSLRDAVNLSWKLDLVLRGIAKDALLDTYESERKPHARFYVDGSDKLGALAFIDDPDEAAQRDRRFIGQTAVPSLPEPKIESGIIHLDAKGKPVAPAGEVGPQGRVRWKGSEGLFDDLFGWGFQILWRGASPETILGEVQLAKLKSLNCAMAGFSPDVSNTCVQDVDGVYARFFEAHEVNGLIVRPDFVVHSGARSTADLRARADELIAQLVA